MGSRSGGGLQHYSPTDLRGSSTLPRSSKSVRERFREKSNDSITGQQSRPREIQVTTFWHLVTPYWGFTHTDMVWPAGCGWAAYNLTVILVEH